MIPGICDIDVIGGVHSYGKGLGKISICRWPPVAIVASLCAGAGHGGDDAACIHLANAVIISLRDVKIA